MLCSVSDLLNAPASCDRSNTALPDDSIRLGAGIRLFDPPSPEPSLKPQPGGLQTGNEIDGASTRHWPVALPHGRRFRGELKIPRSQYDLTALFAVGG